MPDIGFVNGRFCALADAVVSIEDRGFQFGDGVYEVVRTYAGRPFELDAHLARLERSAHALHLSLPVTRARLAEDVRDGIRRAGYPESKVYLQITRGPASRDHQFPATPAPTIVMTVRELHPLARAIFARGVRVITLEDQRWGRCDIKSVNLLPNVLARQRAAQAGAFEAIFVREGVVTEGAVSNLMLVQDGVLITAPEGPRILSGVTRSLVLSEARQAGLSVEERYSGLEIVASAQEVFLTGTTVEVLGVVRIDEKVISSGHPGPVTQMLATRFRTLTA